MRAAIDETSRRREKQVVYNTEHGIVPETIIKEIRDINSGLRRVAEERAELDVAGKEPEELASMMTRLEAQMKEAARNLEFERAAALRDEILQLRACARSWRPRREHPGRCLRRGRGAGSSAASAASAARGLQHGSPTEHHCRWIARRHLAVAGRRGEPWPAQCPTPSSSRRGRGRGTVAAYAAELPAAPSSPLPTPRRPTRCRAGGSLR